MRYCKWRGIGWEGSELLARYLAEEEDQDLVSRLGGGGTGAKKASSGGEKDESKDEDEDEDENGEEEEEEEGGENGKGKGEGGSFLDSWDKRLLRSGGSAEAEWSFQRRVAAQPRQVLRYAYGGSPLWNSLPASKDRAEGGSVPVCQGCGARRVFEMQLMPAIRRWD